MKNCAREFVVLRHYKTQNIIGMTVTSKITIPFKHSIKKDSWGKFYIKNKRSIAVGIPCHYIDIEISK